MATDPKQAAFDEFVTRYARVMTKAIRRVCGRRHRELVPDAEQEVRLKLWRRLQRADPIEHPVTYVYRAALATAVDFVRRQESLPQTAFDETRPDPPATPEPAAHGLYHAERKTLLKEALQRLPVEQRRALRAYLGGFNHREVAALFGWSESEARHRIYRGMESLRKIDEDSNGR